MRLGELLLSVFTRDNEARTSRTAVIDRTPDVRLEDTIFGRPALNAATAAKHAINRRTRMDAMRIGAKIILRDIILK
jgi:hypothetical protein